ncbi:hypothetical protein MLD38_004539 [Melastoma candidum]|uniref:Uncharacterized protein n=1 Tax=Melastoma candidum TaxID=119954 RepID=A0ACB9S7Y3_9MYRT|nr:hypothetical protein MLD38_004539 [Melastoma candidum]
MIPSPNLNPNPKPNQTMLTTLFLNSAFLLLLSLYCVSLAFAGRGTDLGPHVLALADADNDDDCTSLAQFPDYPSKCAYVASHDSCRHKGYINYLRVYYCACGRFPFLGHLFFLLWLSVLFYLLGDTAASYFCPSLDNLSKFLRLSPTIAGSTLLSLGNGAADVFSSIVSFTRTGDGDVGLNSVLGGGFFVSSVVVGVIGVAIGPSQIRIEKPGFFRDIGFLLVTLSYLLVAAYIGRICIWGSAFFVLIYVVYVCTVWGMDFLHSIPGDEESGSISVPLLGDINEEKPIQQLGAQAQIDEEQVGLPSSFPIFDTPTCQGLVKLLRALELPLQMPRRLTIPVLSEDSWSKTYAVISVSLSPLLLAFLYDSQSDDVSSGSSTLTYLIAGLVGLVLGITTCVTTTKAHPPKKCLFPWLAAGFLMSVTWTYIVAEELVSLLASVGIILGISPSILGLTVLAWGNSLGDLISNVAMAINGGVDGVQVAISGCYGGPIFNTLIGLGLSLVVKSWSSYPGTYLIPGDDSLYEMIAFVMGGLLWAAVIVPRNDMRLGRSLGVGLIAIYLCFLSLRLAKAIGLINM